MTDGRASQRQRTRRDLLDAAGRLARDGKKPTLEEVAAEALVSRATAYRYFPSIDALWNEAALHLAFPQPETVLGEDVGSDPLERLIAVDAAIADMIAANEPMLRAMLAQSLERSLSGNPPLNRQNRRSVLIDAALDPVRDAFDPPALERMKRALAMLIGSEGMVVAKDVLRLTPAEAEEARRWAIRALVEAARRSPAA